MLATLERMAEVSDLLARAQEMGKLGPEVLVSRLWPSQLSSDSSKYASSEGCDFAALEAGKDEGVTSDSEAVSQLAALRA